jgi:7-cyano-7-deazaguanine reductase
MRSYKDRDKSLLKTIPSPKSHYEHKIKAPELTFLGANNQPDFGHVTLWFYADKKAVELKSLKQYFFDWRDIHVSYERIIACIYDDIMERFEPERLRIEIEFNARGGISSKVSMDSDWGVLGGSDSVWQHHEES